MIDLSETEIEDLRIDLRREQVATELGISSDLVNVLPYKYSSIDPEGPFDWELKIRAELEALAHEVGTTPDKVAIHGWLGVSYYGDDFYDGNKPIKPNSLKIVRRYLTHG
jgi:hypothetical protein